MSTNTDRVRAYYAGFDEWGRLDSAEGAVEFRGALDLLERYLCPASRVLDLGGGPGRYAVELARRGQSVVLADLSPVLLETARSKFAELGVEEAIESVDDVNAVDLGRYPDDSFDAVLAFGPFYHLLWETERRRAAGEVGRVLRPGGPVFAAYMPRLSGLAGLIERAAAHPDQVSAESLREAAETGVFRNQSDTGFQEGYYPLPGEIEGLFEGLGFRILESVSLKSILNGLGEMVRCLAEPVRVEAERAAASVSRHPNVVATCGHVVMIALR